MKQTSICLLGIACIVCEWNQAGTKYQTDWTTENEPKYITRFGT